MYWKENQEQYKSASEEIKQPQIDKHSEFFKMQSLWGLHGEMYKSLQVR